MPTGTELPVTELEIRNVRWEDLRSLEAPKLKLLSLALPEEYAGDKNYCDLSGFRQLEDLRLRGPRSIRTPLLVSQSDLRHLSTLALANFGILDGRTLEPLAESLENLYLHRVRECSLTETDFMHLENVVSHDMDPQFFKDAILKSRKNIRFDYPWCWDTDDKS